MSLANALSRVSEHFRCAVVSGTQPASSSSNGCPGPGGVASATAALRQTAETAIAPRPLIELALPTKGKGRGLLPAPSVGTAERPALRAGVGDHVRRVHLPEGVGRKRVLMGSVLARRADALADDHVTRVVELVQG